MNLQNFVNAEIVRDGCMLSIEEYIARGFSAHDYLGLYKEKSVRAIEKSLQSLQQLLLKLVYNIKLNLENLLTIGSSKYVRR